MRTVKKEKEIYEGKTEKLQELVQNTKRKSSGFSSSRVFCHELIRAVFGFPRLQNIADYNYSLTIFQFYLGTVSAFSR